MGGFYHGAFLGRKLCNIQTGYHQTYGEIGGPGYVGPNYVCPIELGRLVRFPHPTRDISMSNYSVLVR